MITPLLNSLLQLFVVLVGIPLYNKIFSTYPLFRILLYALDFNIRNPVEYKIPGIGEITYESI